MRAVVHALVVSVVAYAAVAAARHWWVSAGAALMVAALLWWRHPRARFAAYVFFSVLMIRGAMAGLWALAAYSIVVLALMQTASARHAWPRLVAGRRAPGDDRMRRP